jgi:hypothetical protein
LSVSYYLFPSIDAGIQGSYGDYGFRNDNGEKFLTRKTDVSLYLHYKFNNGYILKEDCRIAPYLTAGWAKNRRVEFKVVF